MDWRSRRWIYNGARAYGGYLDQEGAYPRDACEFMRIWGVLYEADWPYIANDPEQKNQNPIKKPDLVEKAKKWPLLRYDRVVDGLDGLRGALAENHILAIGAPWSELWRKAPADGILPDPTDSEVAGGHEFYINGFDEKKKLFLASNSWDVVWGAQGRFSFPYASVTWWLTAGMKYLYGGYDSHFFTVQWGNSGDEDFPVDKIKQLQLYGRVADVGSWAAIGPPCIEPDGSLPIYRERVTFHSEGEIETRTDTTLIDEQIFPGLVRRVVVKKKEEPPPPPPPPKDEPEAIIQDPVEGEELTVEQEKIFKMYVRKKKASS
jgi:hypothetical protein